MGRVNNWFGNFEVTGLCISLFFSILIASICVRFATIFNIAIFEKINFAIFAINFLFGFFVFWKHKFIWATCSSLAAFSIIFHTFVSFYQPSFAPGISFQNYVISDVVSAKWLITSLFCLNLAKIYLMYFFQFFFPFMAVFILNRKSKDNLFKIISLAFIIGLLANSILAIYQGLFDLSFWAQGSGTAVSAGRAAAFLEDSGSSSVYFAAMSVALFWSLVFARSVRWALLAGILLLLSFSGGVFAGGRVFFASCLASMSFGLFAGVFHSIKNRERKRLFLLLAIFGICAVVFVNIFFINPFPSTQRLVNVVKNILGGNLYFLDAIELIYEERYSHVLVMWQAFKEHLWTGTGLGSTLANVQIYGPKLGLDELLNDYPSCFYLQLMSELGIVGLVLVAALITIWLYQVFLLSSGKLSNLESSFDEQSWLYRLVPAGVGAMTSLLVSLLIAPLMYPINSAIANFSLAIALSIMPAMQKKVTDQFILTRVGKYILPSCIVYLLVISSVQALNPPRVPAFRWLERGKPQIALHLNGEVEGRKGYWIPKGTEIPVQSKLTYLYVVHPDEMFPVTVDVELINTSAHKVRSQKFTLQHKQRLEIELPPQMREECLESPTPTSFCSFRVKISSVWYDENFEMGVFVAPDV